MKFYLACRFEDKHILFPIREWLQQQGHQVTSQWMDEDPGSVKTWKDRYNEVVKIAEDDLADIDDADVFVVFQMKGTPIPRGGTHVEFGYALAKNKDLIVVGEIVNLFNCLTTVVQLPDVDAFTKYVTETYK